MKKKTARKKVRRYVGRAPPPPSAVISPGQAEKPATGKVAQWDDVLMAVRELESFCEKEPGAVDYDRLYAVLGKCQNMLARNAALGCLTAIAALHRHTLAGCEQLSELANAEKSIEAVKAVAAASELWPVMLKPGAKASAAAQQYLRVIGVGTKSVLPTVSKIPDDVWARLVCPQIDKICSCVFYLRGAANTPEWQGAVNAWRETTQKWEAQVRALPPQLNSATCGEWWALIREMLEDDWKTNPDARDALFREQEDAAEASNRTAKNFVLMMAERKLRAIAAIVEHPDDYRFISLPPN